MDPKENLKVENNFLDRIEALYGLAREHAELRFESSYLPIFRQNVTIKFLIETFLLRARSKLDSKSPFVLKLLYSKEEFIAECFQFHIISCIIADKLYQNSDSWFPTLKGLQERQIHSFLQSKEIVTPSVYLDLVDSGPIGVFIKLIESVKILKERKLERDHTVGLFEEIAMLTLLSADTFSQSFSRGESNETEI